MRSFTNIAAVLGSVMVLVTGSSTPDCPTFREAQLLPGNSFKCDAKCLELNLDKADVFGTLLYHENSSLCRSGLHAGTLDMIGGLLKFKKVTAPQRKIIGTCRNRICSNDTMSNSTLFSVSETERVNSGEVAGDVLLIHDSYNDYILKVVCLTQNPNTKYNSSNMKNWNYTKLNFKVEENETSKLLVELSLWDSASFDIPGLQCFGTKGLYSDVFAPLIRRHVKYASVQPTWRANKGEDLDIEITADKAMKNEKMEVKRYPYHPDDSRLNLDRDGGSYYLKLSNVTVKDSGLYQIGNGTAGAYFNVIVRECKEGKYGTGCQEKCPQCKNGGLCHSYTGECLCPPGFIGDICQHACPKGWLGNECQLQCTRKTLLFSPPDEKEEDKEKSCKGLTICQPSPLGCSCPAGFKGPICNEACEEGTFGSGCTGSCLKKCLSGNCDSYTGSCNDNDGYPYTKMPTNVKFTEIEPASDLKVTWDDEDYSSGRLYFVTFKLQRFKSCQDNYNLNEVEQLVIGRKDLKVVLRDLKFNSDYQVCITASNATGLSRPTCESSFTAMQAPTLNGTSSCAPSVSQSIECKVEMEGSCRHFNGPNTSLVYKVTGFLACNKTDIKKFQKKLLKPKDMDRSGPFVCTFPNLPQGLNYNYSITIYNDAGDGWTSRNTVKIPAPSKPLPVENLTVVILGKDKARLMWNDPCPSYGVIDNYNISIDSSTTQRSIDKNDTRCPLPRSDFDGCYDLENLTYKTKHGGENSYCFVVPNYSDGRSGKYSYYEIKMNETKPSEPQISWTEHDSTIFERNFTLTITPPLYPGGELKNCTISGLGSQPCVLTYKEEPKPMDCKFHTLEDGKLYKIDSCCCNEKFCGDKSSRELATMPKPMFQKDSMSIGRITNSTITVNLPTIMKEGESNSIMIFVVKHIIEGEAKVKNLLGQTKKLLNSKRKSNSQGKKEGSECDKLGQDVWIAGNVTGNTKEFVVGDQKMYNGFYNCPLEQQKKYDFGILAVSKLSDKEADIWLQLGKPVTVKAVPPSEGMSSIILAVIILAVIILSIILIASLIAALFYVNTRRKRSAQTGRPLISEENYTLRSRDQMALPVGGETHRLPPQPAINMTSLANGNNLQEEPVYENLKRRIPEAEVESYFNKIINSLEVMEEFSSVPTNLKEMLIGAQPDHKGKNRYKNNLPYDETRVKLSIINGDPSTDYINANHVQGYTNNTHYIATQGPKDHPQSTIFDFWRMVVEQRVTAIIMVANFIEGGKNKVGQYLKLGETLTFQNFTIKVVSSDHRLHFTISKVEVFINGRLRQRLDHYHYTNWPDHGVPEEARSIASLITNFLQNHNKGGVVVHCSAGIGRTGTVLMVLLLQEMLTKEKSLDPLEALIRLRHGRGRLVENSAQYNLALEITEEVLFGRNTIVPSTALQGQLESLIETSPSLYKRCRALASPLSYKYTFDPSINHLNRNPELLPADRQRIYLSMKSGKSDSQYINAIKVPGSTKKEALIITEHPVRKAVSRFWRLLEEKKCPIVILINEYTPSMEGEFVPLLPEVGQELTVEGYTIITHSNDLSGTNLFQYSITIIDPHGFRDNVTVYQVLNWKYGSSIPDNPDVLGNLADLLLQKNSNPDAGPPLLCCGDGATACGLVAGVTLLLERAQTEQVFDIYRTVVKLRRSRQQFITSEEQFSMLYTAASKYIENFSIYANIN